MSQDVNVQSVPLQKDAVQALALMGGAIFIATQIGQDRSVTVMSIVAFCVFLMTVISTTLFFFEGRIDETKRFTILPFCLPAVGLLGFCAALFLASSLWFWAATVFVIGFAFALYRRLAYDGLGNLVPSAAMDFGILGGVGATSAGFLLWASKVLIY